MLRKRWDFALVFAALLALPLQAQVGLGLTPMRMEFPAAGGRAYNGALSLSNSSMQKVRVRTQILDFYVDENQTPQFFDDVPAEAVYSCRHWISVNPMEAEMEPQSQLSARYTMRVPANVEEGSHHCAIGFVSLPTNEDMQGIGVRTVVRVVATLYPIVGRASVKGSISDLSIEPVTVGDKIQWRSIVVMENTGRMLYRPQGHVEVVDPEGKVVETLEIASFPVLPQRRQRFLLPLKKEIATGHYTLKARVDLGTEVQEASAEVSVEPPAIAPPSADAAATAGTNPGTDATLSPAGTPGVGPGGPAADAPASTDPAPAKPSPTEPSPADAVPATPKPADPPPAEPLKQ